MLMLRCLLTAICLITQLALHSAILAEQAPAPAETPAAAPAEPAINWHTDYYEAMRAARDTEKMLVVVFCDPRHTDIYDEYLDSLAVNKAFRKSADNIVLCRLPLDYKVKLTPTAEQEAAAAAADKDAEHKEIKLITHSAFAEMHQRPGFVFIDYVHTKSKYYGRVVNIYPFKGRFLSASQLLVMMDLPEGSLTQRTMIFAVRTHPEAPASTRGSFISELAEETESHSQHQANIRVQGHHQWDSRFHRINSRLGRGLLAREVVAESWPGQDLVDAAEEAVHSWRQSPGHWSAVRSSHPVFAFDIKRGLNGIWYATGIFGNR